MLCICIGNAVRVGEEYGGNRATAALRVSQVGVVPHCNICLSGRQYVHVKGQL